MNNITKPIFKNRIIICKIYICYFYVIDMIFFLFYIIKKLFKSINSILETFKKKRKCFLISTYMNSTKWPSQKYISHLPPPNLLQLNNF